MPHPGISAAAPLAVAKPIVFVGAALVGASTITIPAGHAELDLLVAMCVNIDGGNSPSAPGGEGWVNHAGASRTGFGAKNVRTYSKPAASGAEVTGNWSNTDYLLMHVYRNASGLGAGNWLSDGASPPVLSGLTLQKTDGSSWVMAACFVAGLASFSAALTQRTSQSPAGRRSWDSNGGLSSYAGQGNLGSTYDWLSVVVELLRA